MKLILCFATLLAAESVNGLKWTEPQGWKTETGARPMRAATYDIPAVPGDKDNAGCAVYFFGDGQGGSIDANLERRKNQFHGGPAAKVSKRTIHGLQLTTIDASGEYSEWVGRCLLTRP